MTTLLTVTPKIREVKRNWHLFDASDMVLGRLATQASILLMGKHKPDFARHLDWGDHVVIINAEKVVVTGNKELQKRYVRHSGYPGGFREITLQKQRQEHPERILQHAVAGMLPKNKLHDRTLLRLHVIIGSDNPYGQHFKS